VTRLEQKLHKETTSNTANGSGCKLSSGPRLRRSPKQRGSSIAHTIGQLGQLGAGNVPDSMRR
jgi:hypothetical protein